VNSATEYRVRFLRRAQPEDHRGVSLQGESAVFRLGELSYMTQTKWTISTSIYYERPIHGIFAFRHFFNWIPCQYVRLKRQQRKLGGEYVPVPGIVIQLSYRINGKEPMRWLDVRTVSTTPFSRSNTCSHHCPIYYTIH